MNVALCLVLLLWFVPSTKHERYAESDIVCWQEDRKLRWTDFQATTKPVLAKEVMLPNTVLCATTEANAVLYDRTTDTGEFVKTYVRVEFDKRKSWVNKAYYFDRKATLIHEQLHFDVVELTGRRIRRILAQSAAKQLDSHAAVVEAAITHAYDQESTLQSGCDKETRSGDDLKAQARWQVLIKEQLAALSHYKSTPADCEPPQ